MRSQLERRVKLASIGHKMFAILPWGEVEAQAFLGMKYGIGRGMLQDFKQAVAWFSVAADNGDGKAAENRDQMAKLLTPAEREVAQELANRYFRRSS